MIIYLKHPLHGTKVATMDQEAEFDEQNGWERYNLDDEDVAQVSRRGRRKKTEESAETQVPNFLAPQITEGV